MISRTPDDIMQPDRLLEQPGQDCTQDCGKSETTPPFPKHLGSKAWAPRVAYSDNFAQCNSGTITPDAANTVRRRTDETLFFCFTTRNFQDLANSWRSCCILGPLRNHCLFAWRDLKQRRREIGRLWTSLPGPAGGGALFVEEVRVKPVPRGRGPGRGTHGGPPPAPTGRGPNQTSLETAGTPALSVPRELGQTRAIRPASRLRPRG